MLALPRLPIAIRKQSGASSPETSLDIHLRLSFSAGRFIGQIAPAIYQLPTFVKPERRLELEGYIVSPLWD